ncbi:MAG: PDZ domain-containing protein [Planctomycetota bacterium]|nr:PDZ domain-containing protein [Planctomycetota bacterium]
MRRIALLAGLPLMAWPLMAGQETSGTAKLVQVDADGSGTVEVAPSTASLDTRNWLRDLMQSDLDQRELAFDRLVDEASTNQELADWIAATAKGSGDLAWTTRLAQKQLHGNASPPHQRALPFVDPFGRNPMFGDPWAELDRMFSGPGMSLEDIMHWHQAPGSPGLQSQSTSESLSVQSGPEGIKVEIRNTENGSEDVRVYEADSMEHLLEQYPELEGKVGASSQTLDLGDLFQSPMTRFPRLQHTPAKKLLGVYLENRDLINGRLRVTQVQPHSLAHHLGIKAGDELLTLDGKPLGTRDDIASGLQNHSQGTPLKVRVLGTDGEERDLQYDL